MKGSLPSDSDEPKRKQSTVLGQEIYKVNGFLTTLNKGAGGALKITAYNFHKLVKVTAVLTIWVKGTVFLLDRAIVVSMLGYASVFFITVVLLLTLSEDEDYERLQKQVMPALTEISTDLMRFCPFLFGLFTSIILSRWWTLRVDGIGAMSDHTINISGLLCSTGARILHNEQDWERFKQLHSRVVKYGVSALACIVAESRGPDSHRLEGLVKLGMLTPEDVAILQLRSSHAYCLWCWIQAISVEAFEMLKMPPPNHNMIHQEVRQAMQGIHNILMYIRTQLPFPYVHMITLIVNVHNVVLALVSAFEFAINYHNDRGSVAAIKSCKMLILPILYQGLLQICVFLTDPLGDDIIDFPIQTFMFELFKTCEEHLTCRDLYQARWKEGLSPLPNATVCKSLPGKEVAPPPAPPEPPAQQIFGRLDERLGTLVQSNISLADSMAQLQERLSQRNASWTATAESLQAQVTQISVSTSRPAISTPTVVKAHELPKLQQR
jgi:hypothetical protein